MSPCLWIVIVNYRTAELTLGCLRSLAPQVGDLGGGRVVVVDNASGDGSETRLADAIRREGWSDWARLLPQARNGGFAFGNNAGIRAALGGWEGADLVWLLNPDTVVRPGTLRQLLEAMAGHPEAGIVGSGLENARGGRECSAHRFPSPLGELEGTARTGPVSRLLERHAVSFPPRDEAHACDWVSGASMLIRREVLEQVGPMDEGYFLYFEEVDYCCRAREAGWTVWYAPQARVLHLEGAATGIAAGSRRRAAYWYDSRRRFFTRRYGRLGLLAADALWAAGRGLHLSRRALGLSGRDGPKDPRWYSFDLLWGDLRALLGSRGRG